MFPEDENLSAWNRYFARGQMYGFPLNLGTGVEKPQGDRIQSTIKNHPLGYQMASHTGLDARGSKKLLIFRLLHFDAIALGKLGFDTQKRLFFLSIQKKVALVT